MRVYTDIQTLLALKENTPLWAYDRNEIYREYNFRTYLESINFVNQVATLAEEMDHHPGFIITWRKVIVRLHTHSINSITSLDFELAKKIDELFISFSV